MRVNGAVLVVAAGLGWSGAAVAQDLCGNIRLSVSEQLECRGRLTNALGEGDRMRIQQEFEDRIRRANDQLIAPPAMRSPAPPVTSPLTTTPRPAVPPAPVTPAAPLLPGTTTPVAPVDTPAGRLAPVLTAPGPAASPLPPIAPLPGNPDLPVPRP